jgi:hypothetical protein
MGKRFEQFPIIFTHASRTGGGCLMLVIGRQYRKSEVFPFYVRLKGGTTREALEEFIGRPSERKRELKVLGGHVNFGLHKYYDNYTYLTMFRDPVKRIVSLYSLALTEPRYYLHNIVVSHRMKLRDFVGSGLSPELNNGQTRMIAGAENVRFGECKRDLLDLAKSNLDAYYPVFGITERYDESVLLLKQHYGWDTPYYRSQNFSRNNLSKQEVDAETLRVIREHNALDIEFYSYANEQFRQLLARQPPAFGAELARFRKYNRVFHKLSTPGNHYLGQKVLHTYSRFRLIFK